MIRYKKPGRVELSVTDLTTSRRYYEEVVGLQYVGIGPDAEVLMRCDHEHHNIALHGSDHAGLRCAGFMLEDDDQFNPLLERLTSAALDVHERDEGRCRALGQARAVRCFEPRVGATIEFYTALPDAARPYQPTVARIQRIGHVVFNTPRKDDAVAFWNEQLNFQLSDEIGEAITFMRCWPNPYHHGIGIGQFERQCLHHVNFMVTEIDDIGRALYRLRAAESQVVFGPGRHPASGSLFLYFLDPDGLTLEYSFGMETFSETHPRLSRKLPLTPPSFDDWGTTRDSRCFTGAAQNDHLLMHEVV